MMMAHFLPLAQFLTFYKQLVLQKSEFSCEYRPG